jgi:hypothetical protein
MNSDYRGPNRNPPTFLQRINPLWWMGDVERNPNWSRLQWFLRNPFCNFHNVIIGIAHKHRVVYCSKSPWTFHPDGGWNYGYCMPIGGWFRRPFISYRGRWFEAMIGWKTSGAFGYSLRRPYAPNATEHP